ncbi:MAG: RNA helicase [Fibrobacter intestinalis]|uniref:RNA helicase n=1 Tax=Fibrobacter intestinalis TaxID=28122 RepID=UPI003F03F71A
MQTVKIELDYLQGPIWTSDVKTGKPQTGISIIDDNEDIRQLNFKIQDLYDSYYEFNSHEEPCWFNKEQEKADKDKMLAMLSKLIELLNKVNDGSFVIDDRESERIKGL